MTDYLIIFLAALTGGAHCVAMCGGFSLGLVKSGQAGRALRGLALYHGGKIFTYMFLGGLGGALGVAAQGSAGFLSTQRALSLLAGVWLIFSGLQTLGLVPALNLWPRVTAALWVGPAMGPLLGAFRERQSGPGPFYLGLCNGFLPCGWVYAFTLKAVTSGSLAAGMLTMLAFGLGTVPALSALGLSGVWLAPRWQRHMRLVAGVLVLWLGGSTVLRGLGYMPGSR